MLAIGSQAHAAGTLSAKDIMTKNEDARKVSDFEGASRLTTGSDTDKTGKTKDFTTYRKIQADGVHNSTMTRFHAPAEVRDEGILIIENPNGKNDVLLYLPNFKKIRRVESTQQSGSFMGSVFSYSDVATPHVEDYDYKELRTEKCPTTEAAKVMCHVIESTPANNDVRDRTGYSRAVSWVRDDNSMGVAADYYGLDNQLLKHLEANQVKMIDTQNKKWMAHSVRMNNFKTKEFTLMTFTDVHANKGIPDSTFTQQNLQKVK